MPPHSSVIRHNKNMKLHQRFSRLTVWNKIGVIGAVVSIIGFVLYFFFPASNKGISVKGDISNSTVLQVFGNVNLNTEVIRYKNKDDHPTIPKWMVGKVLVPYQEQFAFQGSGFMVIFNKRTFFITSYSLIKSVRRIFGADVQIYVQLPYVRESLFRTKYLFSIEDENSVAYAIDDLIQEGEFETIYLSPYQLSKNKVAVLLGFSTQIYMKSEPEVISSTHVGSSLVSCRSGVSLLHKYMAEIS